LLKASLYWRVPHVVGQLVEVRLGIVTQNPCIEFEWDGSGCLQLVIVDIGYDVTQAADGLIRLIGLLVRLGGMLVGRIRFIHSIAGMLIGGGRLLLCRADAALCPLVYLLHLVARVGNLSRIRIGLFAYLVYLCLDRSRGIANVLFGSAAASQQGAGQDARGRKESFHSFKNLGCS
jgi:hypothetical protein